MRSLDRLFRLMAALALIAPFPAFAQAPAETPAPQASEVEQAEPAKPAPAAPEELRPSMAMPDGARIKLCRKKADQPLEDQPESSLPSRVGGGVEPPKIIHHPAPQFTRSGPTGSIVLEATIDEDGCVRGIKILRSLGKAQDRAAMDAVRQWVFRPAMFNGQPTRVYYSLTVNYGHG